MLAPRTPGAHQEIGLISAALAGIRPAVVGMIAAAAVTVGRTAPQHWLSAVIFAAALVALLRFKVEVIWLIPVAGLPAGCCSR